MDTRMWMVRAGEDANQLAEFLKNKIVSIGWDKLGNLTQVKQKDEIKKSMFTHYPDEKEGRIYMWASQVSRFRFDFKINDRIITYDPQNRTYHVGTIKSDYVFDGSKKYPHIRTVSWDFKVERDKLSATTKNTLGAVSALFDVGDDAEREILSFSKGKPEETVPEESTEQLNELKEDQVARSKEFIRDKILALNWEEMQELVAGLLRAMGYKTIVSSKGSDRGRDVQASPDGLGLQDPRIVVEVKHRAGSIGAPEIRSFLGGLNDKHKALYVSTGGFTKEAKYEAERARNPITLIDSELMVELVIQYYDHFDTESRALINLVKIYWPI